MFTTVRNQLQSTLNEMRGGGPPYAERVITSPQSAYVEVDGRRLLNLCSNNYLGLANHPAVIAAAHAALDRWGFGTASGRGLCGTQEVHKELERRLSEHLGTEDTLLYSSCFDANTGLFESLLDEQDAVVSDALNHASIIDGIRLCKASRYVYANCDLSDLEAQLVKACDGGARRVLVVTDGVFSMEGSIAPLRDICDVADRFDAMVMVDDSHGVGVIGPAGKGTPALQGVAERIDIVTGTLGKALGGASGGYTSGRAEIVELLRQRSRPYIFSNSVAPPIVGASIAVLDLLQRSDELRDRLHENTRWFRRTMTELGFAVVPGEHPVVPIMLGDAALATSFARAMFDEGIYVFGFGYPVVPRGKARIRAQISAAHSSADLIRATEAFSAVQAQLALGERGRAET